MVVADAGAVLARVHTEQPNLVGRLEHAEVDGAAEERDRRALRGHLHGAEREADRDGHVRVDECVCDVGDMSSVHEEEDVALEQSR